MTLTIQQWEDTALLPTSGLEAWHQYEPGVSANGSVHDYSGNARHLAQAASPPILTSNVINGQPAWYFDGTKNPLASASIAITAKHLFILTSASEAAFTNYEGLFGSLNGNYILIGNNATDLFVDLGLGANFVYRKNDVSFVNSNLKSPMSGAFALIEVQMPAGLFLADIQVGNSDGGPTHRWKGHFVEDRLYSRVLTEPERRAVMLYFALKFGINNTVPLYFPDAGATGIPYEHFDNMPRDWGSVTQSYEYEDRGRTFNRLTDDPAREWQLDFRRGLTYNQTVLFDEFWDTVGIDVPFTFVDKFGTSWANVRVKDYSRSHEKHHWQDRDVSFRLVKYP